ncbi:hypothetical protein Ae406Ps2_0699c [Pseudonocardia sp. Ae406_Ps2]|nr:hypothetical protein Ae406Ps2_0699c [Pseudonocardia sp. Ae406_Ps2]OLM07511.1 hypothetical protein Ae331Ps2_5221 [Pseudonocardia sp. Ae331_Ps2]OLM14701.1 hypothetical protein Ae505Ps2_4832 [Pseudonocardia sp. Ae505_Ps2]OLM22276.1 hypothetical protein Ae706Ps2_0708c [Pseudonocardia sp. Ae706_Ps2]
MLRDPLPTDGLVARTGLAAGRLPDAAPRRVRA